MKTLILLICMMIAISISGCNSGGCIKVGGSYKDAGGEIEYCFDAKKSKTAGAPAFEENSGEESKTLFGFTEEEINSLLDKLKDKADIGIKAVSQDDDHPVRELKKMIGGGE